MSTSMHRRDRRAFASIATAAVALAAGGVAAPVQAAPIAPGDVIGIDFGPTDPTNNYNEISSAGSNGVPTGTYSPLERMSDGATVDGVGMTYSGQASNFDNNDGASQDVANYPAHLGVTDSNTTDFMGASPGNEPMVFTWTGLDNSLAYNVYGISSYIGPLNAEGQPVDIERPMDWTVNGTTVRTYSRAGNTDGFTTGGSPGQTMAQFLNVPTDGAGNIQMSLTSVPVGLPLANAIILEAVVPEPGAVGLIGLGAVGLLGRHRARARRRA